MKDTSFPFSDEEKPTMCFLNRKVIFKIGKQIRTSKICGLSFQWFHQHDLHHDLHHYLHHDLHHDLHQHHEIKSSYRSVQEEVCPPMELCPVTFVGFLFFAQNGPMTSSQLATTITISNPSKWPQCAASLPVWNLKIREPKKWRPDNFDLKFKLKQGDQYYFPKKVPKTCWIKTFWPFRSQFRPFKFWWFIKTTVA